jgi:hypothetical protein
MVPRGTIVCCPDRIGRVGMISFSLRRFALCGLSVVVVALAVAPVAQAAKVNVLPPQSKPFGLTYGQWSAEWWKQAVRQTGAPGTPFAAGAVSCSSMGTGDVVFLVGTTAVSPSNGRAPSPSTRLFSCRRSALSARGRRATGRQTVR